MDSPPSLKINPYWLCETSLVLAVIATTSRHGCPFGFLIGHASFACPGEAYIAHWNSNPKPFTWTATADEILAKVDLVQVNIKKLVENNSK